MSFYFMLRIFILFIVLSYSIVTVGQYNICECCSASMRFPNPKDDSLFNSKFIRQNNIHELTIHVTSNKMNIKGKDTTLTVVDKEYNELIIKFNNSGYITRKIQFGNLGLFQSDYEYTRDANNRISKTVFHYLDSLGGISKELDMPETTDYIYINGLLTKTKERDFKQNIQPDEKSKFQRYEYDSKRRVVKEINFYYLGDEAGSSSYSSIIKYNDATNTSVNKTYQNNQLFTIKKTNFDKLGRVVSSNLYDSDNKLIQQEWYYYNSYGQLIKASTKSFEGIFSECPDAGTFTNIYSYNKLGLLESIRHQYNTTECKLRFTYK